MKPISVPEGDGRAVNVLGTSILIRVHGRDTNGILSVVESHDLPGGGPPLHIHHREDETFQILDGEYEFVAGDKTVTLGPGSTLFAPRGVPHTYRCCGSTSGRLLCVITPSGFEEFFERVGALTAAQQQEISRVLEISREFGLEMLGS